MILSLGIGEAVVTVMNERGAPSPVAWTRLRAPQSRMAPADPESMTATVAASEIGGRYGAVVDRDSAREMLAARLEVGAAAARKESVPSTDEGGIGYPKPKVRKRAAPSKDSVQDIMSSPVARDLMRTAAREIVRGVFRVGRRR